VLDVEKVQRWDKGRARAEKCGCIIYDERQRQDDELRLGRSLQKRGGSSSLVAQVREVVGVVRRGRELGVGV
jgi:hypothetical protein